MKAKPGVRFDSQIRFLVENYYDIQKLRVENFNRIVAYIKSQYESENQCRDASQYAPENQTTRASQLNVENQEKNASHLKYENQKRGASQKGDENHFKIASQETHENHTPNASHTKLENQSSYAKKFSAIANSIVSLKTKPPEKIKELVWCHNSLRETERELAKRLDAWSSHTNIRIRFLSRVQGIGPIFSSALIAWLEPISRFDNISKLWKYCGLAPDQKRQRGKKLGYNPHLKTLAWKIACSFEKQQAKKSVYRRLYNEKKKYLAQRPDLAEPVKKKVKGAKLHIRLLALRFIEKRFLADLWVQWRTLERLPVTQPYSIAVLGHTGFEPTVLDKEGDIA